jgi:monoamine oxidase
MTEHTDVVIIGAGFAGLTAARELSRRGRSVVLLEARDRIGGRTWFDHRLGREVELGGAWVHWTQPHVWAEITRYGLPVVQSPVAETAYWHVGGEVRRGTPDELLGLLDPGMTAMLADTREYFDRPFEPFLRDDPEVTALDAQNVLDRIAALGLPPDQDELVRGMWTLNFNAPADCAGLSQALRWCSAASGSWQLLFEACATYKLRHGTYSLARAIADDSRAEIRLGTAVRTIRHDARGAEVHTAEGHRITARDVILTAPLNALSGVDVDPPLSEGKRKAAAQGQASQGIKTWIRVRGDVDPCILFGGPDLPLTFAQVEYSVGEDTLFVAFGPREAQLRPDDVKGVAEALAGWRPDLVVLDVAGHACVADPWAGETWPMLRPGQLPLLRELRTPEGRLQLAGSDYATAWAGFIDGAIESGLAAAHRLLEDRP